MNLSSITFYNNRLTSYHCTIIGNVFKNRRVSPNFYIVTNSYSSHYYSPSSNKYIVSNFRYSTFAMSNTTVMVY